MSTVSPCRAAGLLLILALCASVFVAAAMAQEEPPAAADEETPSLREQTIYVPYSKFRETFEKEGRGVFLPYEQFQKLWEAARKAEQEPVEAEPSVKAVIKSAESEANVRGDVVEVDARLTIELLTPGWHEVPLRLADAAVLSATLGEKPARLVTDPKRGQLLMIEKQGDQPEEIELTIKYAKSYTKSPGQNRVSFQSPLAPVNRWKIRIPEPDVRVSVEPLLAATQAPADEDADPADAAETVLLAFLGAAPVVSIEWTAKAEGAAGLTALATARTEQEVRIEQGVVRTSARISYEISRATLSTLMIVVPPDEKIVNVVDPNVKQWSIEEADDKQTIRVELFEPADKSQQVFVELERFAAMDSQQEIQAPVIQAEGVARQQGVVVVQVADDLRSEAVRRTGLMQIDADQIPERLAGGQWNLAYRFAAVPFDLAIEVEKVHPEIEVETLVEAYLQPERLNVELLAVYDVQKAGVFELRLDVPAELTVRRVTGRETAGAAAAVVDTFQRTGEEKTQLLVNLGAKALGKVALVVELEKTLDDPNLLAATGTAAEVQLALPGVAADGVRSRKGNVVVFAPESLRVNPQQADTLRSVSFEEAWTAVPSQREGRFASLRPVLAFAFDDQPGTLPLTAERRKPHVTGRQLLAIKVEEGVAKYTATFHYDILYSGVKSLQIDVPAALAGELRNITSSLRDRPLNPTPDDVPQDYVTWEFTGQSELIDQTSVTLSWQQPIAKLDVGKSVELAVPWLRPRGVDRAWGQIVVSKSENIDVQPGDAPSGLRPIDPQIELMAGADVADAAQAFEFHDDWKLAIVATKYQPETLKHTSIERALVRMVVTRSDRIAVQALFAVRTSLQRLPLALPAEARLDTDPLRIAGRPQTLERGEKGQYFIPLVGQSSDESFLMELRYTVPGNGSNLQLPQFPSDPALQKVNLCVYLPQDWKLLGSRGPWTDEQRGEAQPFAQQQRGMESDEHLLGWLQGDLPSADAPGDSFPVDGTLFVFSALGPAADQPNALQLTTVHEDGLNFVLFALIAVFGAVLVKRSAGDRLLAVAALVAGLVVLGVFLPTFAVQLFSGWFWLAVMLVIGVWTAIFLARDLPRACSAWSERRAAERTARQAAAAAATPAAEAPPDEPAGEATPPDEPPADDQPNEGGQKDE